MNILAIETSTPTASLCLLKNGEMSCSAEWTSERNHDAHLFPALQEALSILGAQSPDLILVGAGPGSYGGVRVGLAAAVGVATVKSCPVVSICSWLGLAPSGCGIISDAKRGGWTLLRPNGEICVLNTEQLTAELHAGLTVATVEPAELVQQKGITVSESALKPTAQNLIKTWLSLDAATQEKLKNTPAEPIYVRPPHITKAKRKPWEV
jgi:tRNA threonylcarbamoyladenosine biosynthesis protein TsaB